MVDGRKIIDIARVNGATVAGIAGAAGLATAPSHVINPRMPKYAPEDLSRDEGAELADNAPASPAGSTASLLVIGLAHPEDRPELDWWDGRGTPGNRLLIDILTRTGRQVESELGVKSRQLSYYVERGGVFLKDAAVHAGLGCVGRNNLLITPTCGPRIRLRALLLEDVVEPTGPVPFDPCTDCPAYCRNACPERAMTERPAVFRAAAFSGSLPGRDGCYSRDSCNRRMRKDTATGAAGDSGDGAEIHFCRACEFACPVGRTGGDDNS